MKLSEIIASIGRSRPGMLTDDEVIFAVSALDGAVYNDLFCRHLPRPEYDFEGYDGDTPGDTVLLIPDQYADIYRYYLEARADHESGETQRYNASVELFNSAWEEYSARYAGEHRPVGSGGWKL